MRPGRGGEADAGVIQSSCAAARPHVNSGTVGRGEKPGIAAGRGREKNADGPRSYPLLVVKSRRSAAGGRWGRTPPPRPPREGQQRTGRRDLAPADTSRRPPSSG